MKFFDLFRKPDPLQSQLENQKKVIKAAQQKLSESRAQMRLLSEKCTIISQDISVLMSRIESCDKDQMKRDLMRRVISKEKELESEKELLENQQSEYLHTEQLVENCKREFNKLEQSVKLQGTKIDLAEIRKSLTSLQGSVEDHKQEIESKSSQASQLADFEESLAKNPNQEYLDSLESKEVEERLKKLRK